MADRRLTFAPVVLLGLAAAAVARARYDAPADAGMTSGRPAGTSIDMWEPLDEGRDPTPSTSA